MSSSGLPFPSWGLTAYSELSLAALLPAFLAILCGGGRKGASASLPPPALAPALPTLEMQPPS